MANRNYFRATLLLLLFHIGTYVSAQNLPFKHFTTLDGLPSQTVYEALQDRQGFMWFATSAGISRYDGYEFTNYTLEDGLPDNDIFGFYEDHSGRIWLRSMNGKISYIHHGKIFNSENTPVLKKIDRSSQIMKIVETPDSAFMITYYLEGVVRCTPDFQTENIYHKIDKSAGAYIGGYQHHDGSYSIVRTGELVCLANNKTILSRDTFAFTSFANRIIGDSLWLGQEDQFGSSPKGSGKFNHWISTGSLVLNFAKGSGGSIWVCTEDGTVHFDPITRQRQHFLKGNHISHVMEDHEGNIWFTTLKNGILLITHKNIRNFTTADGLSSNNVYAIKKYDGQIYLGHDNFTLSKIDQQNKISKHKFLTYLPSYIRYSKPLIYDIHIEPTSMLISSQYGLCYASGEDVTLVSNLHGRGVVKVNDDRYLVAGRYHGLSSFSKKLLDREKRHRASHELPIFREAYKRFDIIQHCATPVNVVHKQGENKFWVGLDVGIAFFNGDTLVNLHDKIPQLSERVVDVKTDSAGAVFIATSNKGVFIVLPNQEVRKINQHNGLPSNLCNKIQIDGKTLWVGTNAGLHRITLAHNYAPAAVQHINATAGLPSNFVNALLVDEQRVWVGTSNGLSVIDKNVVSHPSPAPLVYITGVAVNHQNIAIGTADEFHHKQNNFKISFVGITYKTNERIYRYALTSGDHLPEQSSIEWQETHNTSVDFPSLLPGHYTFAVMARSDKDGQWSDPVTYHLAIATPFWKTSGFLVLITIAATLLTIYLTRVYQRYRRNRKAEKRKLQLAELKTLHSQMNYHFMSNAFNSLQGMLFTGNNVDQYIGKFSKLMRLTLEHSDRQMITLAAELEYIQLYCDIEQLRLGPRFSMSVACHEQLNTSRLLIPSLTLQPFIENAIWHGIIPMKEHGLVTLTISPFDAFFKIVIEDNGIGVNASLLSKRTTARKSYGTKLIMDRLEVIKQQNNTYLSVQIEDIGSDYNDRSGTRVSLAFPYTYYE
ncbi:sensor histidine kinase [Pseudochryseolinea flava]|uniref:Signal transduction histidine kinase internal region domain-containing protein n=1 Tax=Pseudochryseolinea flava TaxID=2059302 RepID=A0A364Y0Z8_9BACT|nr:two-component regulator propeller domain-containing protein [Pseudochryseolinea flava]RAW00271.1 hypothetical protein DQQ10_14530 [Pseudochryseolinea flava]